MDRLMALVVAVLALAGCTPATRLVVLQNPETLQTVECRVDPWGSMNYARQIDTCVSAYKQAGYRETGSAQ